MAFSDHQRPILGPPPAPDLAGRVPSLDTADLNRGDTLLPAADVQTARRALAGSVAALILLPYAAYKGVALGWLGWGDGLILAGAGVAVALVGVAWAITPLQTERARLRLRLRAARYQTDLTYHSWRGLINGFEDAVTGLYGRRPAAGGTDPTVISPSSLNEELTALRMAIQTLPAQLTPDGPDAPQLAEGPPADATDNGPDLVDLLTVATAYQGGPMAAIVGGVLTGGGYSMRALTGGPEAPMDRPTYKAALDTLTGAGVFVATGAGKAAEPAPQLIAYRARYTLSTGDGATQHSIEDAGHTWALGKLAGAQVTLYAPSPIQ